MLVVDRYWSRAGGRVNLTTKENVGGVLVGLPLCEDTSRVLRSNEGRGHDEQSVGLGDAGQPFGVVVDLESAVPNLKCGSSLVAAKHMMMKSLKVEFLYL